MKHPVKFVLMIIIIICHLPLFAQNQTNITIFYYSRMGHTKTMAEAVAKGAMEVDSVNVKVISVKEAKRADIIEADAIIVGSPVYNANVAPSVQKFINNWPFNGSPLKDKIGAAFVTAGGISAGEELVQMNILQSMLIYGMIVVGGPSWQGAFGASAVTDEAPFISDGKESQVDSIFLDKARALGKRVAEIAVRFQR